MATKMEKMNANINSKKVALDKEINEYLEANELAKSYAKKAKEMLVKLEERYQYGADIAEIIEGKTMNMEKVIVHNKPTYDISKLTIVLNNHDLDVNDFVHIKIVTEVDKKALSKVVKEGKVSNDLIEETISYSLTYKSKFNKII